METRKHTECRRKSIVAFKRGLRAMNKRKWRTKRADGDTVQLKVTSAEQIV